MLDFYNFTDGDNWTTNTNWLYSTNFDTWYGVTAGTNVTQMCFNDDSEVNACDELS